MSYNMPYGYDRFVSFGFALVGSSASRLLDVGIRGGEKRYDRFDQIPRRISVDLGSGSIGVSEVSGPDAVSCACGCTTARVML